MIGPHQQHITRGLRLLPYPTHTGLQKEGYERHIYSRSRNLWTETRKTLEAADIYKEELSRQVQQKREAKNAYLQYLLTQLNLEAIINE